MMTRIGNSKVGDYSFLTNQWVEELKLILEFQGLTLQ
jgi:hypothetical protein